MVKADDHEGTMGKNRKQKKKSKGGRPSKLSELTDDQINDVRRLAIKGQTHAEIAEYLGVSDRTLNRWLNKREGRWLDQTIHGGQQLYGKPSADLIQCIESEIVRLQGLWYSFPFHKRMATMIEEATGIPTDEAPLAYVNKHRRDYLTPITLLELGIHPDEMLESGESVLEVIESLREFEQCLDMVATVEEKVSTTEAWRRYSTSDPLRWKHENRGMKPWMRDMLENIFSEQGSDNTSENTDEDDTET